MDAFTRNCSCSGMICPFCGRLVFMVISAVFGALLAWKPKEIIDIQIAFYRPFNWKLEPISMKKEIRNMRIAGSVIVIAAVISFVYLLFSY